MCLRMVDQLPNQLLLGGHIRIKIRNLYRWIQILEIEHIYSKKRQENENSLKEKSSLESLGNKALLEKNINIRASDYRFTDKIKYYHGYTSANGKLKSGTKVQELLKLSNEKSDYTEQDIVERKKSIIEGFIEYLKDNELIV